MSEPRAVSCIDTGFTYGGRKIGIATDEKWLVEQFQDELKQWQKTFYGSMSGMVKRGNDPLLRDQSLLSDISLLATHAARFAKCDLVREMFVAIAGGAAAARAETAAQEK